jgi:hypothetical protein
MRDVHQGRLDSGLSCRMWWLPLMPKVTMTHSKLKALLLETQRRTYHRVYCGSLTYRPN